MRNKVKLLAIVPALMLTACQGPKPPTPVVDGHYLSVTATFAETFTKSALDPSGAGVWSPGDALNVFYGSIGSGKFSSSISQRGMAGNRIYTEMVISSDAVDIIQNSLCHNLICIGVF